MRGDEGPVGAPAPRPRVAKARELRLPGHPFTDELRFELRAQLLTPALAWLRPVPARAPVES